MPPKVTTPYITRNRHCWQTLRTECITRITACEHVFDESLILHLTIERSLKLSKNPGRKVREEWKHCGAEDFPVRVLGENLS